MVTIVKCDELLNADEYKMPVEASCYLYSDRLWSGDTRALAAFGCLSVCACACGRG